MRGKCHMAIGIACATFAVGLGVLPLSPLAIGASLLGSLAPDLDSPRSTLSKRLPMLSFPLRNLVRHRSATHSLVALVVIGAGVAWVKQNHGFWLPSAAGFLIGYASHIMADMACDRGVEFCWPLSRMRVAVWPFLKTNSFPELVTGLGLAAALVTAGYRLHPARFDLGCVEAPSWMRQHLVR